MKEIKVNLTKLEELGACHRLLKIFKEKFGNRTLLLNEVIEVVSKDGGAGCGFAEYLFKAFGVSGRCTCTSYSDTKIVCIFHKGDHYKRFKKK